MSDLDAIRTALRDLRDLKSDIESREEALNRLKQDAYQRAHVGIPELFQDAGIDKLGIPAEGNQPAYDAHLAPFYAANIAAKWEEERRATAFCALENVGAGDLIKTTITIAVPRGDGETLAKVTDFLEQEGITYSRKREVHSQTLTAFVRDAYESERRLPPLEIIGASIGRIVTLKPRLE